MAKKLGVTAVPPQDGWSPRPRPLGAWRQPRALWDLLCDSLCPPDVTRLFILRGPPRTPRGKMRQCPVPLCSRGLGPSPEDRPPSHLEEFRAGTH